MGQPGTPSVPGAGQGDPEYVVNDDRGQLDRQLTRQLDLRQRDRDDHASGSKSISAAGQGHPEVDVVQRAEGDDRVIGVRRQGLLQDVGLPAGDIGRNQGLRCLDHLSVDIDGIDLVGALREPGGEVSGTTSDVQHPSGGLRKSPQQSTVIVGVVVPRKHRPRLGRPARR